MSQYIGKIKKLSEKVLEILSSLDENQTKILSFDFNDDERLVLLVVIASIPTAFIGLLFDGEIIENFYDKIYLVGFCLMITGVVIWHSKEYKNTLDFANLSFLKAFYIGIVQGLSILPGISRSGTTIAFLRIFGLEPIKAAKFYTYYKNTLY